MIKTKANCIVDRSSRMEESPMSHKQSIKIQTGKLMEIAVELGQRVENFEDEIERIKGFNDNQRTSLDMLMHKNKMLEGENDVLKRTNAALWDRFLGRSPSTRDLHNDVVVHTVDQVLRRLGDGTAQATLADGSDRGTPGDGHWFG
jgi:hypothetical protein